MLEERALYVGYCTIFAIELWKTETQLHVYLKQTLT